MLEARKLISRFSVPPEVEASYATIIDSILAASDINTISAKQIRKGLQQAVHYDLTPQKVCHGGERSARPMLKNVHRRLSSMN